MTPEQYRTASQAVALDQWKGHRYAGDLFSTDHAYRDGVCKWCGAKGSRLSPSAICPGS